MPLSRTPRASVPPSRSWLMALPVVVFLATVAMAVAAAAVTRDSLEHAQRARLELLAGPLGDRVVDRLQSAASVARGTAGLFAAEEVVRPESFHAYVAAQGMPRWFGEGTVAWVRALENTTTEAVLAEGRREYARFAFTRPDPRYPLIYATPNPGTHRALLGMDLSENPERASAIEKARDDGEMTMTLTSEFSGEEEGIEIFYPVYGGPRPDSLELRRATFRGVVMVRATSAHLLGTALESMSPYYEYRITDMTKRSMPIAQSPGFDPAEFENIVTRTTSFGGYTLAVELAPTDSQYDRSERQAAIAILSAGTLLALALSGLVFQQQRARRDAELAAQRTSDALDEAQRRRALLDLVIAQSSDGIIMGDATGTVRIFNAAAARQHGVSDEDLAAQVWNRPWQVYKIDGSEMADHERPMMRAVRGEAIKETQWIVRKPDGEEVFMTGSASPLRDADGRGAGAVIVSRDETTRMKSDADRERLITALEFSNAELEQFASVASHDLKAPLRGIAQLASFLEEDLGDAVNEEARRHFALIQGRVRRLQGLIDGILNYARAGQSTQTMESFDARVAAAEAVQLVGAASTVKIVLPEPGTLINGDKTLLQQALMNLISNALKHGPREGPVHIDAHPEGNFVRFSVKDSGPGIPPEYHQRIWGMFATLSARDEKESTGIGLAVVRKVVHAQGGRTWLESIPGQGATFFFTWPRRLGGEFMTGRAGRRPSGPIPPVRQ
ncbi:MAG: ATP-binding protein [Archangium sp.]